MRWTIGFGLCLSVLTEGGVTLGQPRDDAIEVRVEGDHDAGVVESRRDGPPRATTGEELSDIPGVSVVRRGAAGAEPVVRGQGAERVTTQVGPLPLFGACPGRMDPPAGYLRPTIVQRVYVAKALPSVTLGPAGPAGRIVGETDAGVAPDGAQGWVEVGLDGSRRGGYGRGAFAFGSGMVDGRFAVEGLALTDYHAGDGRRIPADQTEYSGGLTVGITPAPGHRSWHTLGYQRHQNVDYPALPMDMASTDTWIYDGGYRAVVGRRGLRVAEFSVATSSIDHVMNNLHKPNRDTLEAETRTRVRGAGARGSLEWGIARITLRTGADLSFTSRDGTRERFMVGSAMRHIDHLWPDARQRDLGFFSEVEWSRRDRLDFRLGARVDQVASSVGGLDDLSLGGRTVGAQYERFHGQGVTDAQDHEVVGAANGLVKWRFAPGISTHGGVGTSARTAGITERYFAFAPAPGGFQLGNPGLEPEHKTALEWGLDFQRAWLSMETSVYGHWYSNYIASTVVHRGDVNGDGNPDVVRSFRNVDAQLLGGEIELIPRPTRHLSLPSTFAVVYGQDTTHDAPLAEIPPWELSTALRVAWGGELLWWAQVGGRFVGEQDRVDPGFGEDATSGFATAHLRAGLLFHRALRFEVGVENLFDATYHEHLTRETALPVGDLRAGDEIPAPGRYVFLLARLDV